MSEQEKIVETFWAFMGLYEPKGFLVLRFYTSMAGLYKTNDITDTLIHLVEEKLIRISAKGYVVRDDWTSNFVIMQSIVNLKQNLRLWAWTNGTSS